MGNNCKRGMTAVEVMVSTLLAAVLMVALLGVLRGLKVQAAALDSRLPLRGWQQTLNGVLQLDLENSRSFEITPTRLVLRGFAGRDRVTGQPNWLPTTIVYEIVSTGQNSWLVRYEQAQTPELVLSGVASIRVGPSPTAVTAAQKEVPIPNNWAVEFWGTDAGGPLYGYRLQKP